MKRILLIILVVLCAMPSHAIAAQAAAPAQDAPTTTWVSWFTSLRRPTRQDALRAQQFVKSKWRCMLGRKQCSATERNSLRALAAAAAAAIVGAVGYGVKRYLDQQQREAQKQAKLRAEQAERAKGLKGSEVRAQEEKGAFIFMGDLGGIRNQELARRQMINDLKRTGRTNIAKRDVSQFGWTNDYGWGDRRGVAENLIRDGEIDLLRRLVQEGAIDFERDNVNILNNLRGNADDLFELFADAKVSSNYLSRTFNSPSFDNGTLLRHVINWDYPIETIELLLKAGADPTTAYANEDILLMVADKLQNVRSQEGFDKALELMKLFRRHGSSPEATAVFFDEMARESRPMSVIDVARHAIEKSQYLQRDVEGVLRRVREALQGVRIKSAKKQGQY